MAASDSGPELSVAKLERALAGRLIGRRVLHLVSTTSTNDAVLKLAGEGADEGLVIFAEEQTAGRGQHGNDWESASRKGLWFSILLRPGLTPADSGRLTTWAAQSIAASISRELFIPATVKPPNDVHVANRKVAGVLVEMRAQPRLPHLAIAGIGINVNQTAADFSPAIRETAISLAMAIQRPIDRDVFAAALLRELDDSYRAAVAP